MAAHEALTAHWTQTNIRGTDKDRDRELVIELVFLPEVGQLMAMLVRASPEACRKRATAAFLEDQVQGTGLARTIVMRLLRHDWFHVLVSPYLPARWVGRWEAPPN
jgi:hypothetical protein